MKKEINEEDISSSSPVSHGSTLYRLAYLMRPGTLVGEKVKNQETKFYARKRKQKHN